MNLILLTENIVYFLFEKNNYLALETFLINGCFLLLFITTLYYWVQFIFFSSISFSETKNNQKGGVLRLSKNGILPGLGEKNQSVNFGLSGLILANLFLFVQLCGRWIESGHFPLSNLYDSLLFLAWGLLLIFIIIEQAINLDFLGIIVSPTILCLITFTDFSLPEEIQKIKPLVPALQSNWLFMHVTVMILSYAALIVGSLLSISYIFYYYYLTNISYSLSTIESDNKNNLFENRLNNLDNLSYRLIGIGFCLLTLGILSGAIWANETWGNYWSWDPKETWALITWLVFAIYLHSRLMSGLQGIKSAWIAFFGFIILWICYLGVNLLGQGLHSYGFLSN